MEPKLKNLRCPVCGTKYDNYKDYFDCWTSHLQASSVPLSHDETVRFFYQNPQAIEEGMQGLGYEVGIFRGRIDLILRDREGRLCLVDVTTGKDEKRKIDQLKRYRRNLKWLANQVFKVKLNEPVRLFTVRPLKGVKEVT